MILELVGTGNLRIIMLSQRNEVGRLGRSAGSRDSDEIPLAGKRNQKVHPYAIALKTDMRGGPSSSRSDAWETSPPGAACEWRDICLARAERAQYLAVDNRLRGDKERICQETNFWPL